MADIEMVADWPTSLGICCCCLSEGEYKDMMEKYAWIGEKEVYADMLQQCFDLSMMTIPGDDSKRLICEICVTRLRDASRFRIQVEDAQLNYIDRISTFKLSQTQQKHSTELKIEFDWQGSDTDDNYFDDPNFSHFKKTPDEDLDGEVDGPSTNIKFEEPHQYVDSSDPVIATKHKMKKIEVKRKADGISIMKHFGDNLKTDDEKTTLTKSRGRSDRMIYITISGIKYRLNKAQGNAAVMLDFINVCPFKWSMKHSYLCGVCNEKFVNPDTLKLHSIVHNVDDYMMMLKKMDKTDVLKIETSSMRCRSCSEEIEDLDMLKVHLKHVHDRIIDNINANPIFPYKLEKDNMECSICRLKFEVFIPLNQHMNTHFLSYICDTCGKGFATEQRLQYHVKFHTNGEYRCSKCDEIFDSISKRSSHIVKVHKKGAVYTCPYCSIPLPSYHARVKHMAMAHDETFRKFKCQLCTSNFPTGSSRSTHIRRDHYKQRNFPCPECDSTFFTARLLSEHMIKHGGACIYTCQICKKSYQRLKTLNEHVKIHGEKQHVCAVCGRAFTQKCSLKGHMRIHEKIDEEIL